ncbi:MAG: indole-3-glycerol phosphate synthase TrpC [Actinomycetota bacterium]
MSARHTYLDRILAAHRDRVSRDQRDLGALVEQCGRLEACRGFRQRLVDDARTGLAVIAEIKRRSPSKGDLAAALDPLTVARSYAAGGASCLSVLTDADHFGGSVDDLRVARRACSLPVLRKDFTVSGLDVCDARLMGADCVLLIAAALTTVNSGRSTTWPAGSGWTFWWRSTTKPNSPALWPSVPISWGSTSEIW